jgi:hypothetical protein
MTVKLRRTLVLAEPRLIGGGAPARAPLVPRQTTIASAPTLYEFPIAWSWRPATPPPLADRYHDLKDLTDDVDNPAV